MSNESLLGMLIEEREELMAQIKLTRHKGDAESYKNWVKALKDITYIIDSKSGTLIY